MFNENSKPSFDGSKTWWFADAENTALKDANFVNEFNALKARDSYFAAIRSAEIKSYADGYESGHSAGYDDGYSIGSDEGYGHGITDGYDSFKN